VGWEGAAATGAARGFTFHEQKINHIQSDRVNEASKLCNYSSVQELISRLPLLWREPCGAPARAAESWSRQGFAGGAAACSASQGRGGAEIIQLFGDADLGVWRSSACGRAASDSWTRAGWEPGQGRGGPAAQTPGMHRIVVNSALCAHKTPGLHYGRVYKQINLLIL